MLSYNETQLLMVTNLWIILARRPNVCLLFPRGLNQNKPVVNNDKYQEDTTNLIPPLSPQGNKGDYTKQRVKI